MPSPLRQSFRRTGFFTMTHSEEIFDAQHDGFEESRCRVRVKRDVVEKAVMTSSRKTWIYTEQGRAEGITFRVKFRVSDMPKIEEMKGEIVEVQRLEKFEKYRVAQVTTQGGIAIVDMEAVN